MNLLALIYWLSLQSLVISIPAFGTEEAKDASEVSLNTVSDYLLPPKASTFANKKTLVLDLDETLIHSSDKPIRGFHASFDFTLDQITPQELFWVYERPGLKEFLQNMSQMFEVVAWTAGTEEYGKKILSHIDPNKEYFVHSLFRQHCSQLFDGSGYTKELSKLGREMSMIMILDNTPKSYKLNPNNGIPISDFLGAAEDRELKRYTDILTRYSSPDLDITIAIPSFQEEFHKKWRVDFCKYILFGPDITEYDEEEGEYEFDEFDDECSVLIDAYETDDTLSSLKSRT